MKIISNNECYIQGSDLEYLSNNVLMVEEDIKEKIDGIICKPNEYIKIEDEKLIEYIKKTDFLIAFSYLYNIPYAMLDNMALRLRIEISDIEYEESEISNDGDRIKYREKKKYKLQNKKYLLNQIIQMMEYKKGISKCNYPNIPQPCIEGIKSEGFISTMSLNLQDIIIYKLDGTQITLEDNPEFAQMSYKLFMHDKYGDNIDQVETTQTLSKDGKYISVKENLLRENNHEERKL